MDDLTTDCPPAGCSAVPNMGALELGEPTASGSPASVHRLTRLAMWERLFDYLLAEEEPTGAAHAAVDQTHC